MIEITKIKIKIKVKWRWGLLFSILFSILLFGCVKKTRLAEIPEYFPTKKFLENQAEVRQRAKAIRAYKEKERIKYLVRGQTMNYRKWEPIYRRITEAKTHKLPKQ